MNSSSLLQLMLSSLKIGVTGFGGGSALIPVIEREYVQRRKYIDDATFNAHIVVSNITPGGLPVKLAALAGCSTNGSRGALLASIMIGLPGALASVVLLALFSAIGSGAIRIVEFAAIGITVFIAVLLLEYIRKVLRTQNFWLAVAIMVVAYAVTGFNQTEKVVSALFGFNLSTTIPQLNAVGLIVLAVVAVAVVSLVRRGKGGLGPASHLRSGGVIAAGLLFTVVSIFVVAIAAVLGAGRNMSLVGLSTITSFGGGEAYVGVVDGFFLSSGIVNPMLFYGQALPIANALPGSILNKLAAVIGYSFGLEHFGLGFAVVFSALAFLLSVTACCAVVMFLMAAYGKVANSSFVRYLGAVIMPVICGLLLSTMMSMLSASMDIAKNAEVSVPVVGWLSILGVGIAWVIRKRIPDLGLLCIAGLASLVMMSIAS